MKPTLIFIAILLLSGNVIAQEVVGKEKKANAAYENFSFSEAIQLYGELGSSNIEIKRKEAFSYIKLQNASAAEPILKEIVEMDGHDALDMYNYAQVLRINKKYEEAEIWMNKYARENVSDSRSQIFEKNRGAYKRLLLANPNYQIKNLEINSEQQDFAAIFYKDQVVFASSREGVKPIRRKWNWNKLPFLDVYVADRNQDNSLTNPAPLSGKINKKFHEGPVTFNAAGDFMIFTLNNYDGESAKGVIRLQLFSSKLVNGTWSDPASLPFNNNEYSVGHATISSDGKTLIFASNMPGGFGGVDLYRADILEDGTYSEAVNLGNRINTEGDEMFPFVHSNGEFLFFSSNGRVGLGGLDVFGAQLKPNGSIGRVMNMGNPINSNADDFAFILNENQTMGYFSSNREGGKGSDDIYSFSLSQEISFGKVIKGITKNKDGEPLANLEVTIFDLISGETESVTSGPNGEYEFTVDPDKTFNLRAQKIKYFDGTNSADTYGDAEIVIADLVLENDPGIVLYTLVTDKKTKKPISKVKVTIVDNITGQKDVFYTQAEGDYLKQIIDKRLYDRASYNLLLEKEGYLTKTVVYNTIFNHEGKYNISASHDMTLEPIQLGGDLSKIIDIKPIFFDLNKDIIRPDAALELDKIVKVMNENPNMVVELGSHTDSRGSDLENESLSDQRAKASAAYIAERITNPERISGKGYGESKPNVVDASSDGGSVEQILTEEFINSFQSSDSKTFDKYHQMNRRTEFIIIKM